MTKKVEKTIEMKTKDADAWLAALRSGKYEQGMGTLCDLHYASNSKEYCCLGVMQHCLTNKVQNGSLPTFRWLKDHKIKVNHNTASFIADNKDGEKLRPNTQLDILLNPPVKGHATVADLNDSGDFTFKQIANILDKRIKRV